MVKRIAKSIVSPFIIMSDKSNNSARGFDTATAEGFVEHIVHGMIEGWVLDAEQSGDFSVTYNGNHLPVTVKRYDRVDVRKIHPQASAKAGFMLTVNLNVLGHSPLISKSGFEVRYNGRRVPFSDSLKTIAKAAGSVPPKKGKPEVQGNASMPSRHPDAHLIDKLFDADFYLSGFAPDQRPQDPASHYLTEGWQLGRDPTPWFSSWHYLSMNPDVADANMNPFLHYCIAGQREERPFPKLGKQADEQAYAAHAFAVAPGPYFEDFDPGIAIGRRKRAKVLSYYLPQFHSVDVNDESWGKGFTEWRNLPRALPRFKGHIQPRVPRDLGCYDLSEGDIMRRQIEMAKAAGLHGFCFYHYWFDGKRVLEKPMERLLADSSLDFPFCLMWANENWTRTWDGSDKEIILAQNYREDDDTAFVDDLARHMRDPRYIRVGDRPLFFIYRPGQIPEPSVTILRWRKLMQSRHDLNPLIMMAQGFEVLISTQN